MTKFYDVDGKEQNVEWAVTNFGYSVQRVKVPEGDNVYRLVEVHEMVGPNTHITSVRTPTGAFVSGVEVAFTWPDAPPLHNIYEHTVIHKALVGVTVEGKSENAMGKGAYVPRGVCGPHAVWVHDPDVPSDIHECIGMEAGSNHRHLNTVFELQVGVITPDPPGPSEPGIAEILKEISARVRDIADKLNDLADVMIEAVIILGG